jgi:hypothetical protein
MYLIPSGTESVPPTCVQTFARHSRGPLPGVPTVGKFEALPASRSEASLARGSRGKASRAGFTEDYLDVRRRAVRSGPLKTHF